MPKPNNKLESRSILREWLEKLQQESWQLELLISGFALFGIWEAKSSLIDLDVFMSQIAGSTEIADIVGFVVVLLNVGWYIFFINLLIHIILRGLWIGAIGLRYVSDEIDYDSFDYSEVFEEFLRRKVGLYDDYIERLERICSVLFAYTFLLFLFFVSMCSFMLFFLLITIGINKISGNPDTIAVALGLIFMLYSLGGIIVFIDFITTGVLKRIKDKDISRYYFWIFRFYSFVTLSFLYRPLLYNFIDNRYTKKLFFFSVPYILLFMTGNYLFTINSSPYYPEASELIKEGLVINDNYYEDLRQARISNSDNSDRKKEVNKLNEIMLKEYYLKSDFQSIFFKFSSRDKRLFEESKRSISPIFKEGLSWALFSTDKADNKYIMKLDSSKKQKKIEKYNIKKRYRDSARRAKIKSDTLRLDSFKMMITEINADIKLLNAEYKKEVGKYKDNIHNDILSEVQSWVQVEIDSVVMPLNCYYYSHPVNDTKGILCIYDIKDISRGVHSIKVKRKFSKRSKTTLTLKREYIFPVIKTY